MNLPEDLEAAAIGAMVTGAITSDQINPELLSKTGKYLLKEDRKSVV